MNKRTLWLWLCLLVLPFSTLSAQKKKSANNSDIPSNYLNAFKWRNIGPAFTSGRIADIAIHPNDPHTWYVAVASGGVWKTENAGTTWTPLFDRQESFAIGCVTIDPHNPEKIWIGTGENVGGRHIAWGDGLYMSEDGGRSWNHMGLKKSEHISKVVVHPENPDIIWVAAQGPLWSKGDERGLYKSTDGGKTWKKTLGDDQWNGVTDIVMDPRNPDRLYAATWERHRTVAAYLGGGEKSGIHLSEDGGDTWTQLKSGLPGGVVGKIGLAISPINPDYVYAVIEGIRRQGGVYLSTDRGASWSKMSDTVSGATGPHYYNELYASPHDLGTIYLVDVYMQVSTDFGKTFNRLPMRGVHSDSHALCFVNDDPNYLLIGTDGGIYETVDGAKNWRFINNLPVTQYYKVAVDDAEPFYNIYGGTQDNGSHGGPSRTNTRQGIRNADWYTTLGGDGHQSATEPGNPNIFYAESQQGNMHRIDRITGEQVLIQPQPGPNEPEERFNWDAPILISAHDPARVYFASHRMFRSENRGDSWDVISGDLTKDLDRLEQPIMGKHQSWDHAWDVYAMSNYSTISAIGESPVNENILYAGTDDGLIQSTTDGGTTWNKVEVGSIKGLPATAFVNDIRADLFDAETVYAALDNHKFGDFKPYVIKSTDAGKSWTLISGNLPDNNLVWRLVQDHKKKDLIFLGTEKGVFFTLKGGNEWMELAAGMPTISVRDIKIQPRENDLVAASFGRGFFILDDYSPIRDLDPSIFEKEAFLFEARKGLWYNPKSVIGSQGAGYYTAPNPEFGVNFTFFIKDGLKTAKSERKKAESKLAETEDVPFQGFDVYEKEIREEAPYYTILIKDGMDKIIQRVKVGGSAGLKRANWDLSTIAKVDITADGRRGWSRGLMALPGTYKAQLAKVEDGITTEIGNEVKVEVEALYEGALKRKSDDEFLAFSNALTDYQNKIGETAAMLQEQMNLIKAMKEATTKASKVDNSLNQTLVDLQEELYTLDTEMNGNAAQNEIFDVIPPTPQSRLYTAFSGLGTTYGPTEVHKNSLKAGEIELKQIHDKLMVIAPKLEALKAKLKTIGAPEIRD